MNKTPLILSIVMLFAVAISYGVLTNDKNVIVQPSEQGKVADLGERNDAPAYSEIDQRKAEFAANSRATAERQLAEQGVLADRFEVTSRTYPSGWIEYEVTEKQKVCNYQPLNENHPNKLVSRCAYVN